MIGKQSVSIDCVDSVSFDWSKVSILIVDDDSDLLETLCDYYKYLGALVYSAVDGQEALEIIHKKELSLILSDLQMPVMDGATLLETILKEKLKIPFVFITGQSHFTEEKALRLGAQGLVYKPYKLNVMNEKIQNVLTETQ